MGSKYERREEENMNIDKLTEGAADGTVKMGVRPARDDLQELGRRPGTTPPPPARTADD